MLELRYARFWRAASAVLLLTVLAATLMPAIWFWSDKVLLSRWLAHIDKGYHFVSFLVLAVWFGGLYRKDQYWRVGIGLLAFGILIELIQRLVGYRSAEWMDVAADAAGIVVGLLLALSALGDWCRHVERWWSARRRGQSVE